MMQSRRRLPGVAVVALSFILAASAWAQTPAALSGRVSSQAEGAMEGVVVSAKRAGSTITVSVVSDRAGRYSFPADRLAPGQYALKVRAAGYALEGAQSVTIPPGIGATADLPLRKASVDELASQLDRKSTRLNSSHT